MTQRPFRHSPELDQKELAWWEEFADVEDRYSWVQTPEIQRLTRGHYIHHILKQCPSGDIAELGCGTGWLSLLLARLGARNVVGIDFSKAQIAIARKEAEKEKLTDRVSFIVGQSEDVKEQKNHYDLVLMHGFLHHLSESEIQTALDAAYQILKPRGILIVIEPVLYTAPLSKPVKALLMPLIFLAGLPQRGKKYRCVSAEETAVVEKLRRRNIGIPPFGVSPKEIPFEPEELSPLLSRQFELRERKKVLCQGVWAAQNLLLFELSYPSISRIAWRPYLFLIAQMERFALKFLSPIPSTWTFEMFVCQRKEAN